jgi:hypothetical protein
MLALDMALSSSCLKAVTICACADGRYFFPSIDTICAFPQVLHFDMKLLPFTEEGFNMNAAHAAVLAAALYKN